MEKQEQQPDIRYVTRAILIMFGIMFCGYYYIENYVPLSLREECINAGFKEITDINQVRCGVGVINIQLECDKSRIITFEGNSYCRESNKWGECEVNSYKYHIANYTCIN